MLDRATGSIAASQSNEAIQSFLLGLSDALRPIADPIEVQTTACRMLGEFLGVERVHYAKVDEGSRFNIAVSYHRPDVQGLSGSFPITSFGISLMGEIQAGKTLAINDILEEPILTDAEKTAYAEINVRSYIAVPLHKDGQFVAVLSAHSNQSRTWNLDEIALLQNIAERTWEALERARIEQALRYNESRYRLLFDSIDQGFCTLQMVFDENDKPIDYIFIETNNAFVTQTGLTNAIGRKVRDLLPAHEEFWFETYGRIAKTGVAERFEHGAQALNRWYEVYAFRIGGPDLGQVGVLFNDIAARKKTEDGLLRADKAKDNFLAVVSHELKNPLNLIQLNAELLSRLPEAKTQPALARSAETLRRTVQGLTRMVDDLLDLSRGTRNNLTLNMTFINLSETLSLIVSAANKDAAKKSIHLQVYIEPNVMVQADATRMEQVIWNLLSNALKFTPRNGEVTIRLEAFQKEILLEVTDTGVGIDADMLPTIFDMFAQEGSFSNRQKGGLGIGLAIVKQITLLHGGRVEASSAGKSQGASFKVYLPLTGDSEKTTQTMLKAANTHLLLIEDDVATAEMLRHLLELEGYVVDIAHDGPGALAKAASGQHYGLFVSDIGLPGMDGLELIEKLREYPHLSGIGAIAVTAFGKNKDLDDMLAAGFDAVVPKPVTLNALIAAIEKALKET